MSLNFETFIYLILVWYDFDETFQLLCSKFFTDAVAEKLHNFFIRHTKLLEEYVDI